MIYKKVFSFLFVIISFFSFSYGLDNNNLFIKAEEIYSNMEVKISQMNKNKEQEKELWLGVINKIEKMNYKDEQKDYFVKLILIKLYTKLEEYDNTIKNYEKETLLEYIEKELLSGGEVSKKEQKGNTLIKSFSKSKTLLENDIYENKGITFYCGCNFTNKDVDKSSCGFIPKKESSRSNKIEWEHIVAAESFGQSFKEWRDGNPKCIDKNGKSYKGRECAEKVNTDYQYMQSDLYNLVPAIGEINMRRSNYSFAIISGEKREFGECNFEIEDSKVEPADNIMGDIARTYLYMESAYPGHGIIASAKEKLLNAWDKSDPVSKEECERGKKIEKIQGNVNYILQKRCIEKFNQY